MFVNTVFVLVVVLAQAALTRTVPVLDTNQKLDAVPETLLLQGAGMSETFQSGARMSEALQSGARMSEALQSGVGMAEALLQSARMSESLESGATMSEASRPGGRVSEAPSQGAPMSSATDDSSGDDTPPSGGGDSVTSWRIRESLRQLETLERTRLILADVLGAEEDAPAARNVTRAAGEGTAAEGHGGGGTAAPHRGVSAGLMRRLERQYYEEQVRSAEVQELTIPIAGVAPCGPHRVCFSLEPHRADLGESPIFSAHVLLEAPSAHQYVLSMLPEEQGPQDQAAQSEPSTISNHDGRSSSSSDEWIHLDIKDVLQNWLMQENSPLTLELFCSTCLPTGPTEQYQPHLEVKLHRPANRKRKRRDLKDVFDEAFRKPCSVQDYKIRFTDLDKHWAETIIMPKHYWANYCSGVCRHSDTHYGKLLMMAANVRKDPPPTPCCQPTAFKPLSIIYWSKQGTIVKQDIENMIVTDCGC